MNSRWIPYIFAALIGGALVLVDHGGGVWSVIEPFVGGFTAVVAVWLFFQERKRADEAALPRRLTVRYMFDGSAAYTEEQAYLTHEGDARQLAQQIAFQINQGKVEFDATQVTELLRGPEVDKKDPAGERLVFTLHLDVPLSNPDQAKVFESFAARRQVVRSAARPLAVVERASQTPDTRLFVCAGEATAPDGFEVMACPAVMTAESVASTALAVRRRLEQVSRAQVLVKGPVALGVALGHVLQHVPCHVEFLQLDQATKQLGVWWSNTQVE